MKKYIMHISTIGFLAFIIGQTTASIGEISPETILTPWKAIQAFTVLIGVVIVGFWTGQEHERNKHNHEN